jgi:tetratricopeptide (TPR) repeat protein
MRALVRSVVLIVLIGGLTPPARGQKRLDAATEAKAHYELGMTAYEVGHYDRAIEAFNRAYRLDPAPILLFNIAQAHRKKGDRTQAIDFYRRYLDGAPGAADREQVQARIRELEASDPKPLDATAATIGGAAGIDPPAAAAPGTGDPGQGPGLGGPLAQPAPPLASLPAVDLSAAPEARPLYQRPWFWSVVGAAAVVTIAAIFLVRPDRPWNCGSECNLPTRTVD